MSYLVDTNVLLRSVQESHPMHSDAANSIALLLRQREQVSIIPQNLVEYWCVTTRPETVRRIEAFKKALVLLPDNDLIFGEWERLVFKHQVLGKQVYDARLVAAMNVHRVTHLLTFNTDDFERYDGITVISPSSVE